MRKDNEIPRVTYGKFLKNKPEGSIALYNGSWLNFDELIKRLRKEETRAKTKYARADIGTKTRGCLNQMQACAEALKILAQKKPADFTSPIYVDNWLAILKRDISVEPELEVEETQPIGGEED